MATTDERWRVLTARDVAAALNQDEIDMYNQLPDFASLEDPVGDLLKEVASYVRGFCRASGKVKIDPNDRYTIPESLVKPAISIVVYRMSARMPMEVTDSRKEANKDAEELLKKVASGEFLPESFGVMDDMNWSAVPLTGIHLRPNFTLRGSPTNPFPPWSGRRLP